MNESQDNRIIRARTPLGGDVLLLRSMSGEESLGRLFHYNLQLVSKDHNISKNDLLGKPITIELEMQHGGLRYFHGHIVELIYHGLIGEYSQYNVVLKPWLWFLDKAFDCRIFQKQSIPDIVKSVFRDFGFTDFEDYLTQDYRVWDYCVQYRESAFNFVSRLLEKEGIYYYFKHEESRHTLILADGISAHENHANYEDVRYYPPEHDLRRESEHVFQWGATSTVQSGRYSLNDYDFMKPAAMLETNRSIVRDHAAAEYEVYDYPGSFNDAGDGEHYAKTRIEEVQVNHHVYQGACNARGLSSGTLFKLEQHPRSDQNKEYLIISASIELTSNSTVAGQSGQGAPEFICHLRCIESEEVFRTASITEKPFVKGPQTATVVGSSSDEISTDEHARVKLQFHWDRYGQSDESSSCWIRVSQLWAGENWGGVHIPRIGQEVLVDFLEGDPDQPIITGRLYNGTNTPPYGLPENATQSGIKSRSSQGGSSDNYNEIRMEDKKGEEELFFHAEKNKNVIVKNDESLDVGNDSTVSIAHDYTGTIGNNETVEVAGIRELSIGKDQTITVGASSALTVGTTLDMEAGADSTYTSNTSIVLSVGGSSVAIKPDSITLAFGSSMVKIDAAGVALLGPKISLNG